MISDILGFLLCKATKNKIYFCVFVATISVLRLFVTAMFVWSRLQSQDNFYTNWGGSLTVVSKQISLQASCLTNWNNVSGSLIRHKQVFGHNKTSLKLFFCRLKYACRNCIDSCRNTDSLACVCISSSRSAIQRHAGFTTHTLFCKIIQKY